MYTEKDTMRLLMALTKQARAESKYKVYYTGPMTKYGVVIVYAMNEDEAKKKANITRDAIWKVEKL
jgi:hypothetical protein